MAKKKAARKKSRKSTVTARRRKTVRKPAKRAPSDPLLAPVTGAQRRDVGHVRLDVGPAGNARIKRMIYPPGFRWSVDMKPVVGTDSLHARSRRLPGPRRDPCRVRRWLHRRTQGAADRGDRSWPRRLGCRQGACRVDRDSTSRATRSAGLGCRPSIGTKKGRRKKEKKERKKKEEVHCFPLRATKTSAEPGSSSECSNGTTLGWNPTSVRILSHSLRENSPSMCRSCSTCTDPSRSRKRNE